MGGFRIRVSERLFDVLHFEARRLGVSPELLVEVLVDDAFPGRNLPCVGEPAVVAGAATLLAGNPTGSKTPSVVAIPSRPAGQTTSSGSVNTAPETKTPPAPVGTSDGRMPFQSRGQLRGLAFSGS